MTDITADKHRPYKLAGGAGLGVIEYGLVGYTDYQSSAVARTIFKGMIMCVDQSDIDGYAQRATSSITFAGADIFLGIAMEQKKVTSSDTAQGDVTILVATRGVWGFPIASLSVTDIGAPAYAVDTDAVQSSSSNSLWIGSFVDFDATYAWIDISHAAGRVNSAT